MKVPYVEKHNLLIKKNLSGNSLKMLLPYSSFPHIYISFALEPESCVVQFLCGLSEL